MLRNFLCALVCIGLLGASSALAASFIVDISPAAGDALNLGSTTYPGDHALGASTLNESNQPALPSSGGVLNGITYDDVTNMLTMDFGYGSAFGFVDLGSNWNGGVHIHGNGTDTAHFPALNTNAGVIIDLGGLHTASGTRSGRVTGAVALSATQETWLFDNQLYINIHTQNNPGGEVRGQLVVVPEPATLATSLLGIASLALVGLRKGRR